MARDRDALRRVVERLDAEALADGVLESFWEDRDFTVVRPPRAELRTWVRWNIDLVMRWFIERRPPNDAELEGLREIARRRAGEGTPYDTVPANFRRGTRYVWNALVAAADDEDRAALLESVDLVFEYVDRVSRVFADAYDAAARAAAISSDERAAQELLGRLARGEHLIAEDEQLAERIGFDSDRAAFPFVIASPRRPDRRSESLARRLRARRVIAASFGPRVIGISAEPVPWRELGLDGDAVLTEGGPTARTDLPHALGELRALAEVALAHGRTGRVTLDEHLPELMLRASPRLAAHLRARVYGTIEPGHPELADTLSALIEHDFDRARTAAALPVHRNTLAHRLNRIREMTGVDVDGAEGRTLAYLAWLDRRVAST